MRWPGRRRRERLRTMEAADTHMKAVEEMAAMVVLSEMDETPMDAMIGEAPASMRTNKIMDVQGCEANIVAMQDVVEALRYDALVEKRIPEVVEAMRTCIKMMNDAKQFSTIVTATEPWQTWARAKYILSQFGSMAENAAFIVDGWRCGGLQLSAFRCQEFRHKMLGKVSSQVTHRRYTAFVHTKMPHILGEDYVDGMDNMYDNLYEADAEYDKWVAEECMRVQLEEEEEDDYEEGEIYECDDDDDMMP